MTPRSLPTRTARSPARRVRPGWATTPRAAAGVVVAVAAAVAAGAVRAMPRRPRRSPARTDRSAPAAFDDEDEEEAERTGRCRSVRSRRTVRPEGSADDPVRFRLGFAARHAGAADRRAGRPRSMTRTSTSRRSPSTSSPSSVAEAARTPGAAAVVVDAGGHAAVDPPTSPRSRASATAVAVAAESTATRTSAPGRRRHARIVPTIEVVVATGRPMRRPRAAVAGSGARFRPSSKRSFGPRSPRSRPPRPPHARPRKARPTP